MEIGILGTGRMGVRLAAMFADRGHAVVLGSRDLSRAERIASGLRRTNITVGSYEQAANAPIVLPAMFIRDGLFGQLEPLHPALRGKVLIDISNPFNNDYSDFILPWDTSGAEQIQVRLPETRVVGAFKNVWWEVFDAPRFGDTLSDVFVVGDDAGAKQIFFEVTQNTPFRYIDAGNLKNARTIERMTLLSGEMGQRYGFFPRMNYKLLGDQWRPGSADAIGALIART
jgi:8-hydroxy-5-deazaflavin:NADPH oxidoreductase